MITIILFILIGLKLEMGGAYYCIIGIKAGLLIAKVILEAVKEHQRVKMKNELDECLDKLIDDLEKANEEMLQKNNIKGEETKK